MKTILFHLRPRYDQQEFLVALQSPEPAEMDFSKCAKKRHLQKRRIS
jgi:hypothetical protein